MNLMRYLRLQKKSANAAKDRLQIIIAQQRSANQSPDYLPLMRKEILQVIAKYTKVNLDQIKMDLQCSDTSSVLELNVTLPDQLTETVV